MMIIPNFRKIVIIRSGRKMKEALYFQRDSTGKIQCELCPNECLLTPPMKGRCGSYQAIGEKLYNIRYGEIASLAMDPIEKKPFSHFFPGSMILSAGFYGCNLSCPFCQNSSLSFSSEPGKEYPIATLLDLAKSHRSLGIAFTYNEPITMIEYVKDVFLAFRDHHLKTVMVTNGYINHLPLLDLLPLTDAMNIDLKSMRSSFYHDLCLGDINPVLDTIRSCYQHCHIEITYLIVPGENDLEEDFDALSCFLSSISPDIPLHLTRYFPHYHFTTPATPLETMHQAFDIVSQKMKNVSLGNIRKGE